MLRPCLVSLSVAAVLAGPAFAEQATLQPEVVVTASGIAQTVDSVLADVSIITRDDIDASASRDVSDLLRLQAGIDIARTGGPGSQTSVFLRGSNPNHVLVLVDGVRVAALGTGAFTWETLPLDTIERIEIVRGPRASYWGSDAIGGVIQIFTRNLAGPRVALGYGSDNDRKASAGYGQRTDSVGFSVQVGRRITDGFPSQNENGFSYEPKDHGFDNTHANLRGDVRVGTQTLAASAVRSEGEIEFAGGRSEFTQQALGVSLAGELSPRWQHSLNLGSAREDYETPAFFTAYESRRDTAGWRNEFAIGEGQRLIAGIDHVRENGENRDTFSDTPNYRESRDNTGLYAGWQGSFGAFDTDLAVRHDDNSVFGDTTTGSAAVGWRFNHALRAYASHGQGFRGPTLNEQYSPGFGGLFTGNPDLAPEKSRNAEIGLEFAADPAHRFKASVYANRIRNLISFSGPSFQAENVAQARIRGSELGYDGRFGEWAVQGVWTWQDARNEDTDTPLLRRPRQKLAATVDYRIAASTRICAELLHSGKRADVGGFTLPGYTLLNLRATWKPAAAWDLVARIENVTDRDYELARGYNTPDRSGFLEAIWSPGR